MKRPLREAPADRRVRRQNRMKELELRTGALNAALGLRMLKEKRLGTGMRGQVYKGGQSQPSHLQLFLQMGGGCG
ncbi:hypothetical protein TNCT_736641 [Trichonephila clavata]|uniref:Uncharacterized protein n=2 Tax=Trichonephila TaxID=2585208 RepID=A0A8X6KC03_TRICU|nr:hypothetical protein TNCT_736641 [Trichonephila clavata]GFY59896.1 hypothetical protein TNIN_75561 [Trichonephila inaurata madagascariensis]